MPDVPTSRTDIVSSLRHLADQGLEFWAGLDPDRFAAPLGEAWSPAENVRHLIKSTTPVTRALSMPRMALGLMFGKSERGSSSFDELRERYRARLAEGADAGKYAPDPEKAPDDRTAWQRELVGSCRDAVRALALAAEGWSEDDLDKYRIPHPLIGNLTVREMLFFTLYHHDHHRQNVTRRMNTETGGAHPARDPSETESAP